MLSAFVYFCYTSVNVKQIERGHKPVLLEVKSGEQHITEIKKRVEEKGPIDWPRERSKIAMKIEKMGLHLTRR